MVEVALMKVSSFPDRNNSLIRSLQIAVCLIAVLVLSGGPVFAKDKEESKYPNATRQEPKSDLKQSEQGDLSKAGDLVEEGKNDEAQKLIEKVLGNSRASKYAQAYALQLRGRIASDADKDDEAIADIRKAIELDSLPNDAQFSLMLQVAQIQVQGEKYAEGLTSLDAWEKATATTTADEQALRANVYYRLDKFQEAIDTMKRAIAMSSKPNDSWSQILMASYFELNQYDEAAKVLNEQLAKDPKNVRVIQQLANVYIQSDNYPRALEILAKAKNDGLIASSDDYVKLAKLYASADKPKDAAATLKEGMQKGAVQPSFDTWKLLGDTCLQAEDNECALDAYAKASPDAKDGYIDFQRGYVLFYADRSKEAKDALDKAINRGGLKQEGEAYLLRGDAESYLDDNAAALADWQKALGYSSTKTMAEQRIKATKGGVKLKKPKKK